MSTHQGAPRSLSHETDRRRAPASRWKTRSAGSPPQLARYWWVELAVGVLWVVIAAVVLKFDHASVVTVGVLTGLMFLLFAAEDFVLAVLDPSEHAAGCGGSSEC